MNDNILFFWWNIEQNIKFHLNAKPSKNENFYKLHYHNTAITTTLVQIM